MKETSPSTFNVESLRGYIAKRDKFDELIRKYITDDQINRIIKIILSVYNDLEDEIDEENDWYNIIYSIIIEGDIKYLRESYSNVLSNMTTTNELIEFDYSSEYCGWLIAKIPLECLFMTDQEVYNKFKEILSVG